MNARIKSVSAFLFSVLSFFASAEDLSAPEIVSFSLSENTVDVRQSSQQIVATIRVTDNESGTTDPLVTAHSAVSDASSGFASVVLVSGDRNDGVWEATLTIPFNATSGEWQVITFPLTDNANNTSEAFGPPASFNNTFEVISEQTDSTPPEITEFSLSAKSIDVTNSEQTLTVSMRIVDAGTGTIEPYAGAYSLINDAAVAVSNLVLVSGDMNDGVWQGDFVIPKLTTPGPWEVRVFPLSDNASNSRNEFGPPDNFDNSFEVVSELNDYEPPQIIEFSLSDYEVNVGESSQQITATFRITDNLAGTQTPLVTAHSRVNDASSGFANVSLVSGDLNDGIWEAVITLPQLITSGEWDVRIFPLIDQADNTNDNFGPPDEFNAVFNVIHQEAPVISRPSAAGELTVPLGYSAGVLGNTPWLFAYDDATQTYTATDLVSDSVLSWAGSYSQVWLYMFEDINGNGSNELGLFGIRNDEGFEGRFQLFIRDTQTGARVSVVNWPANWNDARLVLLPDLTGDGIGEIGLQGRFYQGNRPQLSVKDGANSSTVTTFSFPDLFNSPEYTGFSDVNGDGIPEIALSGVIKRNDKIQVKVVDGTDRSNRLPSYNFPAKWHSVSWHNVADRNNDGVDDWGLLGQRNDDSRWQVIIKNGISRKGSLAIYSWPNLDDISFYPQFPDLNGDGVPELAVGGYRTAADRYQLIIKDGADRSNTLFNLGWSSRWTSLGIFILPETGADGIPEVALLGEQDGEYALFVKYSEDGYRATTEIPLGYDWLGAPYISSVQTGEGLQTVVFGNASDGSIRETRLGASISAYFADNEAPVVSTDDTVYAEESALVTLTGVASDEDGDIYKVEWVQTKGPAVELDSPDSLRPSFITPAIEQDELIAFSVTVADNKGKTATSTVEVNVNNFSDSNVILRVVRVTTDWMPYASTDGWTNAVRGGSKESEAVKYLEVAIWEEAQSVHLYAFDNAFDPTYGLSPDVTDEQKIAYREQYRLLKIDGLPAEETTLERSAFLKQAFMDIATYIVNQYPNADHHLIYNGHGGPGGRLFERQLYAEDVTAFLAHWTTLLGHKLGVIDMGGPCDKGSIADLRSFCNFSDYYVASDLPNGGYQFDSWTEEQYYSTDPEYQYHTLFAGSKNLLEVLKSRIDLMQQRYEFARQNMTDNKVHQANYLYRCTRFPVFDAALKTFVNGRKDFTIFDDTYHYLISNSAESGLIEQYNDVIIYQATNKAFFEWEVEHSGLKMYEPE